MSDAQSRTPADRLLYRRGRVPVESETPEQELQRGAILEGVHHGMVLPNQEDVLVGSPGCQHCEVLPEPIAGPGTLFLRFPHTYTLGKMLHWLAGSPYPHHEQEGTLTIEVPPGSIAPVLAPLLDLMSPTEQRDSRAHFQHASHAQTEDEKFEITSLPRFARFVRAAWLLDILRKHRLYTLFQPILRCEPQRQATLPATQKALSDSRSDFAPAVYGYECLMRADYDGAPRSPGLMLNMARGVGLLFQLDLAARRSAITTAAQYDIRQKVFINFTPNAIYNPSTCLDSTVQKIDELGLKRHQIVFEIIESEQLPDMTHLKRIVQFYREQGFGVALDDYGAGYASPNLLLELRPDYVKLDRSLVTYVDEKPEQALVARKLLEAAQELGLQTVVEGIERREEWDWARSLDADFVQGYFFARPAVPPPTPTLPN